MYRTEPSLQKKEPSSSSSSFPRKSRTPSFSSSLLDAIYRSIDESDIIPHESTSSHYKETTRVKKQSVSTRREVETISNLDREIMIENWVEEKKTSYKSSSSSSNSTSGGMFSSSSEAESNFREKLRRKNAAPVMPSKCSTFVPRGTEQKPKALKLYRELKKVKQPISPGGRISAFLNSIFNGNAKKVKICSVGAMDDVSYGRKSKSECSSAPPFSHISKSISSNPKKRSVRFCHQDPSLIPIPKISVHQKIVRNSTRKDEVLKKFIMEKESKQFRYDEDEDDDASCSSSDLFELDGFGTETL